LLDGRPLSIRSPRDAIAAGIFLVPEDRRKTGLITEMSVRENITLPGLSGHTRFGLVSHEREAAISTAQVAALGVRTPSIEARAMNLSGGNQQKVVLAKWLALRPRVLIFDEPTRGIDVGAKAEIYRLIDTLANEGLAIMLISSELPEILGMSDRIYVMQGGRITGELPGPGTTEEQVLELAMHEHLTARRTAAAAATAQGEDR